jgi:FAD/FMN-containing dehydrogenase
MTQTNVEAGVEVRQRTGGTITVPAERLRALRAAFRGPVLGAADAAYDETRRVWNGMIDRRPALIARATGTADVVCALRFAEEHELLLSVRGGGHNIAGLAVCEGGLMLDLSLMRGVFVDPAARSARAQAGCTLADVDRETQVHGLAAVLGFVSATGVAGLTVGGGFGYLTRRHGWTCDTLRSLEVVTADGAVLRASAQENAELFWCLRGGSGNFGVVTSFEYELFDVGPEVIAGAVAWHGADAPEVLRFFAEFSASAPRELTLVAILRKAPPAPWLPREIHGRPMVTIFVCHTGRPEDGEALVLPVKRFGKPVADIVQRRPYAQMQSLLDGTQPKGRRYYWKSEYLAKLEPEALDALVECAKTNPSPHSGIILFQLGGALNELPAGHSPAGNRDAKYILNLASSWEDPADDEMNIAYTREWWQSVRGFSTGGVYLNFLSEDDGADRVQAAYGKTTFAELAELKRHYDPRGLFSHTKRLDSLG